MSIQHKKEVDEPDIMVQKFQESISKSESISKQVETISQTLAFLSDKIVDAHTNHEILKQGLANISQTSSNAMSSSIDRMNALSASVETLKNKKDILEQDLINIKSMFLPLSDKISQIEQSINNSPNMCHIVDLSSDIGKLKDTLALFNTQSLSSGSSVLDAHNQLKNIVASLTSDLMNVQKKIEDLASYNEKSSCFVSVLKDKINEGIASSHKYVDDQLTAKIAAIPTPQSISLDDVKQEINSNFESVRLDSSNAKLRSANNETKITILEKKIEQLQLMINKLQLQG